MEKLKFPWIEDEKPAALPEEKDPENIYPTAWKKYYFLLKPYLPYITLLLILFSLSLARKSSPAQTTTSSRGPRSIPLVVSLVPIPKGSPIPPEALDIIEVRANSLTKTQLLRAFTPEQLNKLTHKIVAKKDIPSQVPLFWSDLQLQEEKKVSRPSKLKTEILFSQTPNIKK